MAEPTKRLYLDLDGVMADFDAHFPATFGLDHRGMADDAMWATINAHPSYFRDMPPCPGAIEFFRSIEHLRPIILTACPKSNYPHVAAQKRAWVREHLSKHVTVLPVLGGRHKPLFMQEPGDVLIDDWSKNTEAWTAAGGIAILHWCFDATRDALAEHFPAAKPEMQSAGLIERLNAWSQNDPDQEYFFGGDGDVFSAVLADLPHSVAQEAGEFYENAGAPNQKALKKREAMAVAWASVLRPYLIGLRDHHNTQARPAPNSPRTGDEGTGEASGLLSRVSSEQAEAFERTARNLTNLYTPVGPPALRQGILAALLRVHLTTHPAAPEAQGEVSDAEVDALFGKIYHNVVTEFQPEAAKRCIREALAARPAAPQAQGGAWRSQAADEIDMISGLWSGDGRSYAKTIAAILRAEEPERLPPADAETRRLVKRAWDRFQASTSKEGRS